VETSDHLKKTGRNRKTRRVGTKKNKMRKIILGALIGLSLTSIVAFTVANYEPKNSTAEVEQEEGMFVFYRSKPVSEYEYLGTYKIGLVWDDKPKLLFNKLIRKTKEKYPNANGVIIDNEMDKCDAIKFK
jgi:hypothetical protein